MNKNKNNSGSETEIKDTAIKDSGDQSTALNQENSDQDVIAPGPSDLAMALTRLKSATVNAASKREHLPQPLFWSLFHQELKELKQKKELARVLNQVLGS